MVQALGINNCEITDSEYARVRTLLHGITGISLGDSKKTLVVSRLTRRLSEYKLRNFTEYLSLLDDANHRQELQTAVDLLTTNETYFFRETNHFTFLQNLAAAHQGSQTYRVWSAACSYGQEAYSIAMVLQAHLGGRPWEVLASDISKRAIEGAGPGQYPIAQADKIPPEYLSRFCLKGVGKQHGTFIIDPELARNVHFFQGNLIGETPNIGQFDVIFLRNVMIYFDNDTKRKVIDNLLSSLKRGGHLLIGHSESLNGLTTAFKMVSPSLYRKL